MPPDAILAELEKLALRLGIHVRSEPFGLSILEGRGGLCWLSGKPVIVMDQGLPIVDRIAVLAAAIGRFDLEPMYLPPVVRRRIDRARGIQRPGIRSAKPRPRREGAR
ncbi:MAG: hypothetical protein U0169_09330 [Polyangiaceae bacterium]